MKKYMAYRVEGRRPGKTWLESVEADMAELEMSMTVKFLAQIY